MEAQPIFERQAAIWQNVLEDRADNRELEELDGFINNTSIRLRLICKETAVELPGDMYADCWEKHEIPPLYTCQAAASWPPGFHYPTSAGYAGPKTVVISVSNTRTDDCPAASVLQMVREKGCALYVTDAIPDSNGHVSNHPAIHFLISKPASCLPPFKLDQKVSDQLKYYYRQNEQRIKLPCRFRPMSVS